MAATTHAPFITSISPTLRQPLVHYGFDINCPRNTTSLLVAITNQQSYNQDVRTPKREEVV